MADQYLRIKRGPSGSIPTLADGEPAFTTDTFKLFIGYDGTNREIGGSGGSGVDEGDSFPSTPSAATLFYRTDLEALFIYSVDAGDWIDISGLLGVEPAVGEGTEFPSDPGQVMLFFRTDLDTIFLYSPTVDAFIDLSGLVSGGGLPGAESISSATNANNNTRYLVDTTGGAVTLTLPTGPSVGDVVYVIDAAGNFSTNGCQLDAGSEKIMGSTQDYLLTSANSHTVITYVSASRGWNVASAVAMGNFVS